MTATPTSTGFARNIRWMAAFVGALIVLVVIGWYVAAHFYRQALDEGRERLAAQGITVTCPNETLGGFPARFEWRCGSLQVAFANGATLAGGAFQTVAPVWNPLFTIAEWTGPFETVSADGFDAHIASPLARASVRLDTSLTLERLSMVLDPFEVSLQGAPQAIAFADQAEVHVRHPDGAAAGDYDVAMVLLGFRSLLLGGVDRIDLSVTGLMEGLGSVQARSLEDGVRQWIAQSGRVTPLATRLRLDDHAINLDGDVAISPQGVLDFDGTIATNDVAALVELFGIDDETSAAAIVAGASLLGRRTTIGEDSATELPLMVDNGIVRIGPVSLGALPPLVF